MGGAEGGTTAPTKVSTPAAQTRFVLTAMDELTKTLLTRFDAVDVKIGVLEKVQAHLEEIDSKLLKHADTLEQMQVKVNLSMDSLGKVQEEQNRVSSSLKGPAVSPLHIPQRDEASIMGEPPDRWTNQRPLLALGATTSMPKVTLPPPTPTPRAEDMSGSSFHQETAVGIVVGRRIGAPGCLRWIFQGLMGLM